MATNAEAYSIYGDSSKADIALDVVGIDPSATDKNKLSMAYGMIDAATTTMQKVGDTQESTNNSALLDMARKIFDDEGVDFPVKSNVPKISPKQWP